MKRVLDVLRWIRAALKRLSAPIGEPPDCAKCRWSRLRNVPNHPYGTLFCQRPRRILTLEERSVRDSGLTCRQERLGEYLHYEACGIEGRHFSPKEGEG